MTGCRHNAKNTLPKNYLHLAEAGRRRRASADHGHRGAADAGRRLPGRRAGDRQARPRAAGAAPARASVPVSWSSPPSRWCSRRRRWAPSGCCTRCATGRCCRTCRRGSAICPGPTPSRSSARSPTTRDADYSRGRGDHVVVPSRRAHARRAGALRQGQQRDEPAADRADRRRRRRRSAQGLAASRCGASAGRCAALRLQALVGADRHRPGDADARQLDHRRTPSARGSPAVGG